MISIPTSGEKGTILCKKIVSLLIIKLLTANKTARTNSILKKEVKKKEYQFSGYLYVNWRADRIKPFLPIDVIAMIQSPGDVEI